MMGMTDPEPNGAFEWTQEPWGRALRCTRLAAPHLFSSRDVQLRDDQAEWTAVAASMGVPADHLLLVKQVHGIHVAVAGRGQTAGWARPQADVIVSDDPDVAIGVRVADCAPVLLYDRRKNAVGAVHAGWRGAAADAAGAGVRAMTRAFKSNPADLVAAIGPCLGKCCGEVGPEVVEAFRAGGSPERSIEAWFHPGERDRSFLDLERANRDQLEQAGVHFDNIYGAGLCTKTHHERLHSYRAARESAGRLVGTIRAIS
jgi:YfiH family protein